MWVFWWKMLIDWLEGYNAPNRSMRMHKDLKNNPINKDQNPH